MGVSVIAGGVSGVAVALVWLLIAGRTSPATPAFVGIIVGILVGALVGFLNGSLITSLGLPPFIVTLATLEAIRGLVLFISGGTPVSPDPSWSDSAVASMGRCGGCTWGSFSDWPPTSGFPCWWC